MAERPIPIASRPGGIRRVAVLVWWSAIVVGLCIYGAHTGFGLWTGAAAGRLVDGWLYSSLVFAGAVCLIARAVLVREERLA